MKKLSSKYTLQILELLVAKKTLRYTDISEATKLKPVPLTRALKVLMSIGLITQNKTKLSTVYTITQKAKPVFITAQKLITLLK